MYISSGSKSKISLVRSCWVLQGMLIDWLLHPSRFGRSVAVDTCRPDFGKVRVDVHIRGIWWVRRLVHGGQVLRVHIWG